MSLEKIFDEIFDISINIRYIGIYQNGKLQGKMRKGLRPYLDEEETKRSITAAVRRWEERKEWEPKIGRPIYTLTMYAKVKRITIQIAEDVLLLMSTDIECEHEKILLRIFDFKKKINDSS